MRILVAGGGSGGHVTPALAILEALATQDKNIKVCFVCDKKFAAQAKIILSQSSIPIDFKVVAAGKFRRYHGVPLWKQLLDVPTVLLNARDLFLIGLGILQSRRIIRTFKPDVVFGKGGFVCMPVGIAAHQKNIPLVIHDSDAHPGLTNRVLSKWATYIATGAPLENYNYDASRSFYTGIPVGAGFTPANAAEVPALKSELMANPAHKLVAVVGGGLGAWPLNQGMVDLGPTLAANGIEAILVTGAAHGEKVKNMLARQPSEVQQAFHVEPFVDAAKMARILKAADVVVSRGGATAMAELTALGKATVLVPNPQLTGGQQLKNAKAYEEAGAVVLVDDTLLRKNSTILEQAILWILRNDATKATLEQRISRFAKPNAAKEVAQLIIQAGQGRRG